MKILTKSEAEIKLGANIPDDIKLLSSVFNQFSFDLFLVGGSVRDTFLNQIPKDFDVATNATPNQIQEILEKNNIKFQLQGVDFGVVVAKMSEDIEIATFRTDQSNDSGEMKDIEVEFGCTIETDVKRRDITINGLFFNIENNTIIDLVGGINDLEDGIVRTIGNPDERFKEDNLRKLRAIRFSTRLGFELSDATFKSIKKDPTLNVSDNRIVNELFNSFSRAKSKTDLIRLLVDTDLCDIIFQSTFELSVSMFLENVSFAEFVFVFVQDFKLNDIKSKLTDLCFPSNVIETCVFLKQLQDDLNDNNTINPNTFFKNVKRFKIDSINVLDDDFFFIIDWLFKFKPDKDLVQKLMRAGFSGKDLGDELNKIHCDMFDSKF